MHNTEMIDEYAQKLYDNIGGWQDRTLARIGRRMKRTGRLSAYDQKALKNMADITGDMNAIYADLARITAQNIKEVQAAMDCFMNDNTAQYEPLYDFRNIPFVPYSENTYAQDIVSRWVKQTAGEMINLSQTKALSVIKYGLRDGKRVPIGTETLRGAYQSAIDKAVFNVTQGIGDFSSSMRDVIRDIGGSGIRVNYGSGVTRPIDSVIRQNMLYAVKEMQSYYDERVSSELGCDGFEVNFSAVCRPSHTFMEGKTFSYEGDKLVGGVRYPDGATALVRLNDYNCHHRKTGVILGVSEPRYSAAEISEKNRKTHEIVEYDGKKKTRYEWIQEQRKIERQIRANKTTAGMAYEAGDSVLRQECNTKIRMLKARYDDLTDKVRLQAAPERMRTTCGLIKSKQSGTMRSNNISTSKILSQDEVIEKAKILEKGYEYQKVTTFQELRSITNKKLGYDKLPQVLSKAEFNRIAVAKDVIYRGVKETNIKSASEIINEFKYGEFWTGNSGGAAYGNGVYFAKDDATAKKYSTANGKIFEATLSDDAKVVDYLTIYREYIKTGIPQKIGNREIWQHILGDVGQYAAVKGYDAIATNGFQNHDYIILLNRTKCIVKE